MNVEQIKKQVAAIRNDLKSSAAPGRGQSARQIASLTRSVESVCGILETFCQPREKYERISGIPTPQTTEIQLLGETMKSPAGYWFRVTRITYAEAPRVRVELMREGRSLRSIDSTDHAFRELGAILSTL